MFEDDYLLPIEGEETTSSPEEDEDYNLPVEEEAVVPQQVAPAQPSPSDFDLPIEADEGVAPVSQIESDAPTGLTKAEFIANPALMDPVREYMVDRRGVNWTSKTDEEVLDAYTEHMRWVGGNEVSTLSEYRYVTTGDEARKMKAGDAYKAYEALGSVFTNDGVGGAVEGVWDYTKAVLTSPSTYLGAVVGKAAVAGGGKLLGKAAINAAIRTAYKTGGKKAAEQVIATAVKKKALATIGAAAVADSATAVFQDRVYQSTMMEAAAQDEYSLMQGALASLGGIVGGGVAAIPEIVRGTGKLSLTGRTLRKVRQKRAATAIDRALPRIRQSVEKLNKTSASWAKMVQEGKGAQDMPLKELSEMNSWFFDSRNPDSVFNILAQEGMRLTDPEKGVTEQFNNFIRNMPPSKLDELNEALDPLGVKAGEIADIVSHFQSKMGVNLNLAQQAGQLMKEVGAVSATKRRVDMSIVANGAAEEAKEIGNPKVAKYVASLWRRMLVSHPATTAVNVMGWGQAYGARSMAEVLHGGVLGIEGTVGSLVNKKWGAAKLAKSRQLLGNQIFKAKTLLDPYSSRESFEALLGELGSTKQKDAIFREYFGGVGHLDNPEAYNIPTNKLVRGAEKFADGAAYFTLVKTQDAYTKSLSGLAAMDRVARRDLGKGFEELIANGETHLITSEMMNEVVDAALKDTFSKDYTKGFGGLSSIADIVEKASNAPYLGFLFPFGRFMNNNMAFVLEYSPLSLAPMAAKMASKGGRQELGKMTADEISQRLAKAVVGTTALATLIASSSEDMEEGLQWYQTSDSTGEVVDRTTQAPASVWRIAARIGVLMEKGEGVPIELFTELGKQLGPGNMLRAVDQDNPITPLITALTEASTVEEQKGYVELLGAVVKGLSGVASGFTRPLEPLNAAMGGDMKSDVTIDKRQAESSFEAMQLELLRYTDSLFAPFLGEPFEEGGVSGGAKVIGTPLRSAVRPEGDIYEPNPIGRLAGHKEIAPMNSTDKLFGMVNFPPWMADQRTSIPAYDRYINETVGPMLEDRSKRLLESKAFQNATQERKLTQVKSLVNDVRQTVRDQLEGGEAGGPDGRLKMSRYRWSNLPEVDRNEARRVLNITTPDNKLNEIQLRMLRDMVDNLQDFNELVR